MTKEEYIKIFDRICDRHTETCKECELFDICYIGEIDNMFESADLLNLLGRLEKWAEEHPVKTNLVKKHAKELIKEAVQICAMCEKAEASLKPNRAGKEEKKVFYTYTD